jgi:hypothetical protein
MRQSARAPRTLFRVAVALLFVPLAALAGGCAGNSGGDAAEETVASLAAKAEQSRAQGRASLAARQYEQVATAAMEAGDTATQVDALLDAAECWLLDGKASVASVDVDKAAKLVPRLQQTSSRERFAQMRLHCLKGDVAFGSDLSTARKNYDAALARAVGRERDAVLYRQALLAEQQGDPTRAKKLADSTGHPRSPLYEELRDMLHVRAPAPTARANPPAPIGPAPVAVAPAPKSPPILPRSAWNARRTRANFDRMTQITRITVHHTATRLPGNSASVAADAINAFQRQHQEQEGWADIGYHFLIDPSGRIWEGRPLTYQGAHAGSPELNVGNIGIALIGDFTVQQPSAAQKKALIELLDSLCAKYRVEHGRVYTHQEIRDTSTECPGPALQRVVEQWRRGVLKG